MKVSSDVEKSYFPYSSISSSFLSTNLPKSVSTYFFFFLPVLSSGINTSSTNLSSINSLIRLSKFLLDNPETLKSSVKDFGSHFISESNLNAIKSRKSNKCVLLRGIRHNDTCGQYMLFPYLRILSSLIATFKYIGILKDTKLCLR